MYKRKRSIPTSTKSHVGGFNSVVEIDLDFLESFHSELMKAAFHGSKSIIQNFNMTESKVKGG